MKKIFKSFVVFLTVLSLVFSCCSLMGSALTNDNQHIPVEWESPTEILKVEMQEKAFVVSTKTPEGKVNNLYFTFPTMGGVRFNADTKGFFEPQDTSVINYSADGAAIVMQANDTKVKLFTTASPWRFEVYNAEEKMVTWYEADKILFGYDEDGFLRKVKTASYVDEYETLFGLGERFGGFVQNGKTVEMWNADALSQLKVSYGDHNVGYKNVPLLHSNNGYSIFHNNNYYGIVDVGESKKDECSFQFYGPILDIFIWTGNTTENIDKYCSLTGSSVTVPKYALSYWAGQSSSMWKKDGEDAELILETVKTNLQKYDELNTPIKVIFMEGLGSDSKYGIIQDYLNQKDTKFLGWMDSSFRSFDDKYTAQDIANWVGLTSDKMPLVKWNYAKLANYYGNSGEYYVDYSNPSSKLWVKSRLERFMKKGLIGMMVDYNDNIITVDTYYPYVDKDGTIMHNLSQYYYSKNVYEAFNEYYGEGNFVNIVRAGVAGSQSYGANFGGDQSSTFMGLQQSVSALLSAASSGFNVWGSDIGGLGTPQDAQKNNPELYARWLQFGTFSPLMRTHGQSSWRDPWNYGNKDASNALFQKYYWTRESIVDLVNSGIIKASLENDPLTKAMVIAFLEDKKLAGNTTQYMFCDSLLVCPVTEDNVSAIKVQFPKGRWVNIWDGSVIYGDCEKTVSATTDTIPVYLQAGSAFPSLMGEELKFGTVNTLQKNAEVLVVAPATEKKVNTIYKDTENKEIITCDTQGDNSYTVTNEKQSDRNIVLAMGCNASEVSVDGKTLEKLSERPTSASSKAGYYVDTENNTTIIITGGKWTSVTYTDSNIRLSNVAHSAKVSTYNIKKNADDAVNITDGDYNTYMTLNKSKNASIVVDLGKEESLDKILVKWGGAYAKSYTLDVSKNNGDDAEWTTVYKKKNGGAGTDTIYLDEDAQYRYLKISDVTPDSKLGARLVEIEAFGDENYTQVDGVLTPIVSKGILDISTSKWYLIVGIASSVVIAVSVLAVFLISKKNYS